MTKTINPHDIFELAKSTGRSPSEILQVVEQEGWIIDGDAPRQAQTSNTSTKRTSVMNDPKGAIELMRELREETIRKLYKNDPVIREGLDAQMAIEASRAVKPKESNFTYDEQGNLSGVKSSVVSGVNATVRNQTELMREIKNNIYKKYGVSQ